VAGFALHDFVRDLDFGVQVNAFPPGLNALEHMLREVHYDEQEEEIEDFGKPGNQLDKA